MKTAYLVLLSSLYFNTAWADFSNTRVFSHPLYAEANEPFLLEIRGDWSSDCHPGEQKPVISGYTGDTVLIAFEIITEHVTCNDVETPYRVLVDMSDVVGDVPGEFPFIEVTMRFGGSEFKKLVDKSCLLCDPPPPPRNVKPEAGLYYSNGLEKQGLLIARQNQRMGVYPLVYDESGSSEWVLGPGGIVEDVFFAELYESTGGQCLGCPPPDVPPQMGAVGKISMLMDGEGVVQVKINDGFFTTYEPLNFGYGQVDIGGNPAVNIPDLSGRWAIVETDIEPYLGSPPPTSILPLVFDIVLMPPPTIGDIPPIPIPPPPEGTPPPGNATYLVRDMDGEEVAEMRCDYETTMICKLAASENSDGFAVRLLSPERMTLTNLSPITLGKTGTGTAVRID